MTDDLDGELRARLASLAGAVPVDAPGSMSTVTARVRPGRTGRRLALGGLVPLVAIVVVVIGTVAAGFVKVPSEDASSTTEPTELGPPGSRETPAAQVAAGVDVDGPYMIELRSERRVYHESDVLEIAGAFTYAGDAPIDVQGFKPLVFSIAEPVYGIDMDTAVTLECNQERLEPGERMVLPFRKGGGVSTSDPQYDFKRAYLMDPVLRLPPGTWHIRLTGWLYEGDCGTAQRTLSTEIEILVLPDAASGPSRSARDSGFILTLQADRER